jgi:N-acylglucosamine 2-epimerase
VSQKQKKKKRKKKKNFLTKRKQIMTSLLSKDVLEEAYSVQLRKVLKFWLDKGIDKKNGGIWTALDRYGKVIDTDKSVWFQGRAGWMFATFFLESDGGKEYLDAAISCVEFLREHCFADSRKMFFTVSASGLPMRMRRYVYSEAFAAIAFAAVFSATKKEDYRALAIETFESYVRFSFVPGVMEKKSRHEARGLGALMIGVVTAQELRKHLGDAGVASAGSLSALIGSWIADIEQFFVKEDLKAVMEMVSPLGEVIDNFDGRTLNPGHAIEASWFIMNEFQHTKNQHLLELGLKVIEIVFFGVKQI